MKLNMVCYLIKEGMSEDEALDKKKTSPRAPILIKGTACGLYLKKSRSSPKWSKLFDDVTDIDKNIFKSESVKGLLIIPVEKRLLAFTFGHGRSMIKSFMIERGFGLKVALNIGDSEKIKSIDKSTLEKVSLNTRSQTSKNTHVSDFDFEFDTEILKSICAVVESDENENTEIISGCDSVSINTDVELDIFPYLAKRLLDAYRDEKYKEKYPWVDFIQAISDPALLGISGSAIAEDHSKTLSAIFAEDQKDRKIMESDQAYDWDSISIRDEEREKSVRELIETGKLKTGEDYYHAAMILQHGVEPEDHLLAHDLCIVAIGKGEEKAKWLAAASLDRFLIGIGREQR